MTLSLKHTFASAKPDGTDASQVQPSHWNAEHTLQLAGPALVGRSAAGTGPAVEVAIGSGLTLVNGTLSALGGEGAPAASEATPEAAGLMSAADKAKLDGVATAATANAADAALRDRTTHTGTQAIGTVTGLQAALDGKAATAHGHAIADVAGLQAALDGKATPASVSSAIQAVVGSAPAALDTLQELAAALNDDSSFAASVTTALAGKAPTSHGHAVVDVTGLQAALDGKAPTSHGHAVADVSGLQAALAGKAPTSHGHAVADVSGLQAALDGKAAFGHAHSISGVTGLFDALQLRDLINQLSGFSAAAAVDMNDALPVRQTVDGVQIMRTATLAQLLAPANTMVAKKDQSGAFIGMSMPGGLPSDDLIVISTSDPINDDGRPNGTLYIQVS